MAIRFHCDHCGKEIKAADEAGGKWGKCPSCHSKIYVPNLNIQEELSVAPLDESDEEKEKRLMAETYALTQDILKERELPEGATQISGPGSAMGEKELTTNIIMYLRQMADGFLDEAEATALAITSDSVHAVAILDKIALSDIPEPELADVAPQVLAGLIRTLRGKLG